MEFCSHARVGAAKSSRYRFNSKLFTLSCSEWAMFYSAVPFHREAMLQCRLSLDYSHFYGRFSNETNSLVLLIQIFRASTHYSTSTESNQSHFPRIPVIKNKFHFFSSTSTTLLNRLPQKCFPERYNLNPCKRSVNRYFSYLSSSFSLPTTSTYLLRF